MDESYNDDSKSEFEAFKLENDNLKRENEKITIDYELKIENLKKEINLKSVNYENLMINFQELDAKYKNSCQEKIEVNQNYYDLSQEKFNVVKKYDNLESEHNSLLELIARREKDILNLKNEIQEMKSQLIGYKNKEIEMKLNKNDLEYRRKDFDRMEEMSLIRNKKLAEEIKSLEEKLIECKKQNFEEKSQHNKVVYDLNLDLESKKNEIKNQKKINDKLREKMNHLEKVNEEKNESLRSAVESQTSIDNLLRKELSVQTSISDLLREERDECQNREKNLVSVITELQDTLKETYEESEKIKSEFETKLGQYSHRVSELQKELNQKEAELASANELMEKFRVKGLSEEELKSMNPATASAISALKRGFSMTQIYCEYLQVVNERDELRVDRDRLNEYMITILEELENKAPLLKKQQDEHSNLELSVSMLSKKYDDNLSHLISAQSDLEDYRRKCDDLSKKLKREEQMCTDLSMQICFLLREIETYRGTIIQSPTSIGNVNQSLLSIGSVNEPELVSRMRTFSQRGLMHNLSQSSSMELSQINNLNSSLNSKKYITSKDVITTHLVTFKNICELQQKNIQLIDQVRDLSEQQEMSDALINENSMQELAKKLEQALHEVDELREKHKQNKQLMKTVNAQRQIIQALSMLDGKADLAMIIENMESQEDLSQSLTTINDGTGDKRTSNHSHMNSISLLNGKVIESQEKIDKLQSEVEVLRKEKELLKDKHSEIVEELKKSLSDSKMNNANLLSKLSINQDKTSCIEQNLMNRQLELTDLQNEKCEMSKQLAQKTEENKSINNELINCQRKLKELESEYRRMQQNMKNIESLEEQIKTEKSEKYQLIMSTSNLATQISNLQASLAKPQSDQSTDEEFELKSRIKQLSLELKQEKSKYQNSLEIWQAKFSEASSKVDSMTSELNMLRNARPSNLVISDSCTVGVLQNSSEKREKTSDLENQLEDLTVINLTLKKQLESYQELMSNSESKLISNSKLVEEMEARFHEKIDEERQKNAEVESICENIQLAYVDLENEYKSVKKGLEDQIEELFKKLDDRNSLIDKLNDDLAKAEENVSQLKIDMESQKKWNKEAYDIYQQELIFHAQESDALQEMTKKMNKFQKQERDLSEKLQEAVLLRDQYKTDLEKADGYRLKEKQILENEISELRAQKDSLNNRLIDLNDSVVNLKKMLDPSIESGIDYAIIQKESDWNEVIQYLRQEKEGAEKIKNQFEIDLHRLKSQCCQQEEQIQQLNNALEEERKFKVLEAETSKHHSEVMRKLELGQMLSESNAMLRQDRERLQEELSDKTNRLEKLQEIIEPMKAELKAKTNEMESVKLDARSLEKERDLWRKRCDALIEKSKQINPEDFKQICVEKDELQHQLFLEEDKCRIQLAKIDEMQEEIDNSLKSIKKLEEQTESLKKTNDENVAAIQRRDTMVIQLKDIGRKYKSEAETLNSEIAKITEVKEEKIKEVQKLKKELSDIKLVLEETRKNVQNQASTSFYQISVNNEDFFKKVSSILQCQNTANDIFESTDKLVKENQNNIQLLEKVESENKLRNQAIEGTLSKLKHDNERLKKQVEASHRNINVFSEDDNGSYEESSTDVLQTTSTWHNIPTVARVAANVHPVVQKPQNIVSAANHISPNSQPVSACTSTARQTAEIRPIHAVALHMVPSSNPIETSDSVATASVTTSLPANVVQALAASSVSSVIFPTVTGFSTPSGITSSTSSGTNRLKRCFDETIETEVRTSSTEQQSSSTDPQSAVKKIRIRESELTVPIVQEPANQLDQQVQDLDTRLEYDIINELDEVCEGEIEIESENVDNADLVDEDNREKASDLHDTSFDPNTGEDKTGTLSEEEQEEEEEEHSEEIEYENENVNYDENEDEENDGEDEDEDEENEEDDDEVEDEENDEDIDDDEEDEDDDDENPDVIDLLSSDDDNDELDNNHDGNGDHNDPADNNTEAANDNANSATAGNSEEINSSQTMSSRNEKQYQSNIDEESKLQQETDLEQAKKKIEPIVWGDNSQRKNVSVVNKKQTYLLSPPRLGQPIKTRYTNTAANTAFRRKIVSNPRRNYPFPTGASHSMSQIGRRSGGPFKGRFPRL